MVIFSGYEFRFKNRCCRPCDKPEWMGKLIIQDEAQVDRSIVAISAIDLLKASCTLQLRVLNTYRYATWLDGRNTHGSDHFGRAFCMDGSNCRIKVRRALRIRRGEFNEVRHYKGGIYEFICEARLESAPMSLWSFTIGRWAFWSRRKTNFLSSFYMRASLFRDSPQLTDMAKTMNKETISGIIETTLKKGNKIPVFLSCRKY